MDGITLVFTIVGTLLSLLLGLVKYTVSHQIAETNRRISDTEDENKLLRERVHQEELFSRTFQGEIALLKQSNSTLDADLEEIKRAMVTKVEFEARSNNSDKMLGMILMKIDGTRYASTGAMPAARGRDPRKDP